MQERGVTGRGDLPRCPSANLFGRPGSDDGIRRVLPNLCRTGRAAILIFCGCGSVGRRRWRKEVEVDSGGFSALFLVVVRLLSLFGRNNKRTTARFGDTLHKNSVRPLLFFAVKKCSLVGLKRICYNTIDFNRKDGVTLMRGKVLAGAAGRDSRLFLYDDEKDVEYICG